MKVSELFADQETKNAADTLHVRFVSYKKNPSVEVGISNVGTDKYPIFIYTLKYIDNIKHDGHDIFLSSYPIVVTRLYIINEK